MSVTWSADFTPKFPVYFIKLTAFDGAGDHVPRPPQLSRLRVPRLEVARLRVLGAALRSPGPRAAPEAAPAFGLTVPRVLHRVDGAVGLLKEC